MSHRAPVWPPHTGIIGAAAARNRGPHPPVCPPPPHYHRQPASTSPYGLQIPPGVRLLTLLPTSTDHKHPTHHRANVLPKGRCLS
jgi:hypothetical protein